jgi:hypothetical protein
MDKATPRRAMRTLIARALDVIEHVVFRESDLDAIARGWEVRRNGRLGRAYRDPRWDPVSACPTCHGTGMMGARTCPTCDGIGTVRQAPATKVRPS